MIIIGLSNSKKLGRDVSRKLNVDYFDLDVRHSVEGEMHMRFDKNVKGQKVFLVQSFYPNQNNALIEVLFAANHAKDLNAKEVILIAPYLSYLREDFRSDKNECVSITILGEILSGSVDSIISVDPHVQDLKKHFSIPVYSISSYELIKSPVLIRKTILEGSILSIENLKILKNIRQVKARKNKLKSDLRKVCREMREGILQLEEIIPHPSEVGIHIQKESEKVLKKQTKIEIEKVNKQEELMVKTTKENENPFEQKDEFDFDIEKLKEKMGKLLRKK